MTLLHLDSSILGANSVSRSLSASVVAKLQAVDPSLQVVYRDLAADPIAHLSGTYLAAGQAAAGQHDPALTHDLAMGEQVMKEFLAADIVVIGVAQYNFSVPSQLKAWIDRIAVAGKTFRYTEAGPEGLMGDKRVILAVARGGLYGPGSPTEHLEHTLTYLRSIMSFFGINQPEIITADGLAVGAEQREASIKAAQDQIASLEAA